LHLSEKTANQWKIIKKEFGMENSGISSKHLLARSEDPRYIYFISDAVKQIVFSTANLKIVNTGIKIFTRKGANKMFRICSDGIQFIEYFITKRKICITEEEFKILLTQDEPFFTSFSDKVKNELEAISKGAMIFHVTLTSTPKKIQFSVVGWRGQVSVYLMLDKINKTAYKSLIAPHLLTDSIQEHNEARKARRQKRIEDKEKHNEN